MNTDMINKKTWNEFRETGLFLFINSILHAFGWAIVVQVERDGSVSDCYPARVKFRGFDTNSVDESHKRIGKFLKENADTLNDEANG